MTIFHGLNYKREDETKRLAFIFVFHVIVILYYYYYFSFSFFFKSFLFFLALFLLLENEGLWPKKSATKKNLGKSFYGILIHLSDVLRILKQARRIRYRRDRGRKRRGKEKKKKKKVKKVLKPYLFAPSYPFEQTNLCSFFFMWGTHAV